MIFISWISRTEDRTLLENMEVLAQRASALCMLFFVVREHPLCKRNLGLGKERNMVTQDLSLVKIRKHERNNCCQKGLCRKTQSHP